MVVLELWLCLAVGCINKEECELQRQDVDKLNYNVYFLDTDSRIDSMGWPEWSEHPLFYK